ncbi:hypothetical protein AAMO2058_001223900 [Amorphochlora amoebiformis]
MSGAVKKLLHEGKVVRVFNCGQFLSHKLVEIVGLQGGYHGLFLDQEHASSNLQRDIEIAAIAAKASGLDTFVRRPADTYAGVMAPLEAGAGGVLFSMIRNQTQAEQAISWAKFAPRGSRGLFGANRDGSYGLIPGGEYAEKENERVMIGVQIETQQALEEVDGISKIPDLDLLFVGPHDLSQVLGVTGQVSHERVWKAIGRVSEAAKKAGVAWGTVPADDEYAKRALDLGCQLFLAGHDFASLHAGINATKAGFPSLFGAQSGSISATTSY